MKIRIVSFGILSLYLTISSCNESVLIDKPIKSEEIVYLPDSDMTFHENSIQVNWDSIIPSKKSLELFIDTSKYTGYNDFGYRNFKELYSCTECDSIILNFETDPRMSLYAYYKLVYEKCNFNESKALSIIDLFQSSNYLFEFGVGENTWREFYLAEEAIDVILTNKNFSFTEKETKRLKDIHNSLNSGKLR
jgi:hypothetical protein